jgi:hypothetical protein
MQSELEVYQIYAMEIDLTKNIKKWLTIMQHFDILKEHCGATEGRAAGNTGWRVWDAPR